MKSSLSISSWKIIIPSLIHKESTGFVREKMNVSFSSLGTYCLLKLGSLTSHPAPFFFASSLLRLLISGLESFSSLIPYSLRLKNFPPLFTLVSGRSALRKLKLPTFYCNFLFCFLDLKLNSLFKKRRSRLKSFQVISTGGKRRCRGRQITFDGN